MSKRSRENETKDVSNKKQMSLLSMFKPTAAPSKPVTTITQADIEGQSVSVTSTAVGKNPRDLFKNVDEETLELLDLEIRTMNYEWLKVLAPELLKPYFLKVKKKLFMCLKKKS